MGPSTLSVVVMQSGIVHAGIGLGLLLSGLGGIVLSQRLIHQYELGGPVIMSGSGVLVGIGVWFIYAVLSHVISARFAVLVIVAFVIIEIAISIAIYRTLSDARATVQR